MVDAPVENDVPQGTAPKRRKWALALVALLGLIVGFVGGAGVTAYVIVTQVRHMMEHPEEAPAAITARLDSRLDLSPEQEQAVEAVLRNRFKHLHQAVYTAWPVVDQILDQIGEDIRYELNAEQKQQWDTLYPEIRERWFKQPPDPNEDSIWE
jgi:hypothetical protein